MLRGLALYGADAVQMVSAILRQGPSYFRVMRDRLADFAALPRIAAYLASLYWNYRFTKPILNGDKVHLKLRFESKRMTKPAVTAAAPVPEPAPAGQEQKLPAASKTPPPLKSVLK